MEKIKNKDGKIVSYREKVYVNGKAVTKTFKRKSDAADWKKSFQVERQRREALGISQIKSIDFESFAKLWIETKENEGVARSTMESYTSTLNLYLRPVFGKNKLETISQRSVQDVIRYCKGNKLGAVSINITLDVLKQILNYAVRLDYLVGNPLRGVKRLKEPPRSLNYWLPEQVKTFLAANEDEHHYPLYVLALNTGMRRGEIFGLCWDKVNLRDRMIEISRIRDSYGLRETTKTGVVRHIPLNDAAWGVLEKLSREKKDSRFVFLLKNGSPPNPGTFSRQFYKKAIKRAGVPEMRFHDLRVTYASNFVMAGGDVFALSKLLGHTQVEMTTRKYAALHPDFMKNVVETISFGGKVRSEG